MTKTEARRLFGGKAQDLAAALGITPGAVSQWPEQLDQRRADQVRGAAMRLGVWPPEPGACLARSVASAPCPSGAQA